MSRLPLITARKLIRILNKLGFVFIRQTGSHMIFEHYEDGRLTVIPNHKGENIDRGLLHKIITKDLKISIDEFLKFI